MDKSLHDDVPIEAKMVSKAIERAQNTVEGRNAEIRKDVLKYDEVMNEQRKVIYGRRQQIIDGEDLRRATPRSCSSRPSTRWSTGTARASSPRSGTSSGLLDERHPYFPTAFTSEELAEAADDRADHREPPGRGARRYYGPRRRVPGRRGRRLRQIERDVMLPIIDQRWRDHLYEMDYLQEGINLRAMGQQDPLVGVAAGGLRHVRGR